MPCRMWRVEQSLFCGERSARVGDVCMLIFPHGHHSHVTQALQILRSSGYLRTYDEDLDAQVIVDEACQARELEGMVALTSARWGAGCFYKLGVLFCECA